MQLDSRETRDAIIESDMEGGVQGLDILEALARSLG